MNGMEIGYVEQERQWLHHSLQGPSAQLIYWAVLHATFWKPYESLEMSNHDDKAYRN